MRIGWVVTAGLLFGVIGCDDEVGGGGDGRGGVTDAGVPDLGGGGSDLGTPMDLSNTIREPSDLAGVVAPDAGGGGGGGGGAGGGGFVKPGPVDDPLVHAAPTPMQVRQLAGPTNIYDVSADDAGGIWAVSPHVVAYWPQGGGQPFIYSHSDGLARGNAAFPFASVAGTHRGQAIIGNRGAIADHLLVDPGTGKVIRIDNMAVPFSNTPEYAEWITKVTSGIRVVVDYQGVKAGSAYIGGIHGFTIYHGINGDCACEQFEQHAHYFPDQCDDTEPQAGCWGGDVRGLAMSPEGDVWAGDNHFVSLFPQRSKGMDADIWQAFKLGVDVFPKVNDDVWALSVDGAGGVWVASYGNGLAYLRPMTFLPTYFDRARVLPQDRLTTVAVDVDDSVWVGTPDGGIARLRNGGWAYYTERGGLPSDSVRSIFIDRYSSPRRVLLGTSAGVSVYTGP